ncbi:MAG: hypothetical protein HYY37_04480 [Candidatus Aenigmarchaeota archaeon]|nr:hypothetical protein [Candidatus Aenigmarchaeota archaeon]
MTTAREMNAGMGDILIARTPNGYRRGRTAYAHGVVGANNTYMLVVPIQEGAPWSGEPSIIPVAADFWKSKIGADLPSCFVYRKEHGVS